MKDLFEKAVYWIVVFHRRPLFFVWPCFCVDSVHYLCFVIEFTGILAHSEEYITQRIPRNSLVFQHFVIHFIINAFTIFRKCLYTLQLLWHCYMFVGFFFSQPKCHSQRKGQLYVSDLLLFFHQMSKNVLSFGMKKKNSRGRGFMWQDGEFQYLSIRIIVVMTIRSLPSPCPTGNTKGLFPPLEILLYDLTFKLTKIRNA